MKNFYKEYKKQVDKYSVDEEGIVSDIKIDNFEKKYFDFFVEGILYRLISENIEEINADNVSTVDEPKDFWFDFISKTVGYNDGFDRYLNYTTDLYFNTRFRGNAYDLEDKSSSGTFEMENVIKYIIDVLSSEEYGIKNIEVSTWVNTVPKKIVTGGPWNKPQSSIEESEKSVSFKCTLKQLIRMYYLEHLRYLYNYQADNYMKESDKFKESLGRAK